MLKSDLPLMDTPGNPRGTRRAYKVERPNVLFVMADQHRHDWMGCAGVEQVQTPALDGLADRGVRFTQATCNSPLCAPSRAALATGQRPPRCHVLDNSYSLDPDAWNVYQQFRRYGYRTGLFGKLDLHKPQGFNGAKGDLPILYQLGFTDPFEAEGKQHGAHDVGIIHEDGSRERLLLGPYQQMLNERGLLDAFSADYELRESSQKHYAEPSVLPCDAFEDAWIGENACDYLRAVNDDSPWFLFVSFVGPHNPWDSPAEYLDRYRDVEMPDPILDTGADRAAWLQAQRESMSRGTDATTAQAMRQNYSGMVTLIDDYMEQMLGILEERGLLDNTIVAYTSDHGEMLGDLGLVHKSVQYESALRVPMIMAGPGVPQLDPSDALVELFDLTPTLLDLLGLPVPPNLDARSFLPLLKGETDRHRDVQIAQLPFTTGVRGKQYKAIINPNDRPELYDLQADPEELHNIYEQQPEVYDELCQVLRREVTGGLDLEGR